MTALTIGPPSLSKRLAAESAFIAWSLVLFLRLLRQHLGFPITIPNSHGGFDFIDVAQQNFRLLAPQTRNGTLGASARE
ncbi:MAG TPA: hypothetical protein VFA65_08855 [Bryobacteraceae bacterium]|nr:hypothetical protein [Bryobacteraceae bacterium]